MDVALVDCDHPGFSPAKFPNLALMKISMYHKRKLDMVSLVPPLFAQGCDKVYASKVFSWTPMPVLPEGTIIGGGGADELMKLPDEIENICPDYNLYPDMDYSMGFLTRGCIRDCWFCSVRQREGPIRPAADIESFLKHGKAVLLDNNVLACDWGIKQIEKIAKLGIKVDFNQGMDARLIDDSVARLLSKVKWLEPVRLACDNVDMIPVVHKAVEHLRWHNVTPRRYSCYVMLTDNIQEGLERIRFLKGIHVDAFVQPYIPPDGKRPTDEQMHLTRWANRREIIKTTTWEDYKNTYGHQEKQQKLKKTEQV